MDYRSIADRMQTPAPANTCKTLQLDAASGRRHNSRAFRGPFFAAFGGGIGVTSPRNLAFFLVLLLWVPLVIGQSSAPNRKTINPTFTTIDVPGALQTVITGINSAGEMVGWYSNSDSGSYHSFSLSGGVFTFFDYPGAASTIANGINDSGLIVGIEGESFSIFDTGFLYDGLTFTSLKVGANSRTFLWGVDNAGDLAGGAGTANSTRAFVKQGDSLKAVNFPGLYTYAYATGMNKLGQIIGWTVEGSTWDSYLYANGKFKKIDVLGAIQTAAFSISDNGLVAGYYENTSGFFGFALYKGKSISFGYPGAVETLVYGMNSAGQVVGTYSFDYQTCHGLVTSPVTSIDFE